MRSLKGGLMFMNCIGYLASLRRERKTNMQFRELTYEFWMKYRLYKGNAKLMSLIPSLCSMTPLG